MPREQIVLASAQLTGVAQEAGAGDVGEVITLTSPEDEAELCTGIIPSFVQCNIFMVFHWRMMQNIIIIKNAMFS